MSAAFKKLTEIVDTLMGENGCPWDKVQTRESLKPYLLEEAYETLEALDNNNPEEIKEELGDLLYQILFHAKISENKNEFNITDVVESISDKMVHRHPHVFQEEKLETPEEVITQWEEIKSKEKGKINRESILDGIPSHLPGLLRAQKLQKKAAKHGFDWDKIDDVFDKLDEEDTYHRFQISILCKDHRSIYFNFPINKDPIYSKLFADAIERYSFTDKHDLLFAFAQHQMNDSNTDNIK